MTIISTEEIEDIAPEERLYMLRHSFWWERDVVGNPDFLKRTSGNVAVDGDRIWIGNEADYMLFQLSMKGAFPTDGRTYFVRRTDLSDDDYFFLKCDYPEIAEKIDQNMLSMPLEGVEWGKILADEDDQLYYDDEGNEMEAPDEIEMDNEEISNLVAYHFDSLIEEGNGFASTFAGFFVFDQDNLAIFFENADDMVLAREMILDCHGLDQNGNREE
jgi:hypothetical protein